MTEAKAARDTGRDSGVRFVAVDERGEGQRLDNFILRHCPSVPKTRLYRAMRKGEIRVNKGRAKPDQRLNLGDSVRIPPLSMQEKVPSAAPAGWQNRLAERIVHEDEHLLVLNKPSGIAVHGGSGLQFGLIETLRVMRPEARFLELVHRLDRETSGLILIAKKPATLKALHTLLRNPGGIDKRYLALVAGKWPRHLTSVEAPLQRYERASGERMVRVAQNGKPSSTSFAVKRGFPSCTLVEAQPHTGRTHQIRVHAAQAGHHLLGDTKYATSDSRAAGDALGVRRLFLHAHRLSFTLGERRYRLNAVLDPELEAILERAANALNSRG